MSELTRYRNGCLPHDRVATKPLHTPTTPNAKRPSEEGSENYYVQRHAAVSRNLKALVAKAGEQSGEGSECETCPIKENATDSDPQENSRERFKLIFKNTKTKLPDLEGVLSLCSNSFESSIEQNNDVSNSWIVLVSSS